MNTNHYLEVAQALRPRLAKKTFRAVSQIKPRQDAAAYQGWTAHVVGPAERVIGRTLEAGDTFVLDFGQHIVGYLKFTLAPIDEVVDAPVRLKIVFAEMLCELGEPLDPSPSWLCRSWMQDEVFNFDWLPQTFQLPRRYAFRYVKVTVVATPRKIRFKEIACQAVTSGTFKRVAATQHAGNMAANDGRHATTLPEMFEVGVRTLRDCMQTVFEDGPKRDRRLWLGDLRLQAQCNYQTFRNFDLVKRCLYLFAALPLPDGMMSACVYEYPEPITGGCLMPDYSALYIPTLLDYANASGDWATAGDLWPVALKQIELLRTHVDADGVWDVPYTRHVFADWKEGLDKHTTAQAVMIYSWKAALVLAEKLDKQADVTGLAELVEKMTQAARSRMFDAEAGLFVSGPDRQVSYSSNAWMVLAGVVEGPQAADVLTRLMARPDAVKPATPYLFHHLVEAMFVAGMKDAAAGEAAKALKRLDKVSGQAHRQFEINFSSRKGGKGKH